MKSKIRDFTRGVTAKIGKSTKNVNKLLKIHHIKMIFSRYYSQPYQLVFIEVSIKDCDLTIHPGEFIAWEYKEKSRPGTRSPKFEIIVPSGA